MTHLHCDYFQRVYDPSQGEDTAWYINDHCFVQDDDGLWHMFGITHREPAQPLDERFLAHATSMDLLSPQWAKQPHVLPVDPAWEETHVWAPHVVRHEGLYYMFYCAGGSDHRAYRIHLATSPDLWQWARHPANPMLVDGFDARDPMVIRYGEAWIMYYTANRQPEGGHHTVAAMTSRDLCHWGDKREVLVHPQEGTFGGPTESPFVVARDGKFYLFVCTNAPYNTSAVYESDDPFHWNIANCVGEFPSHASEIIVTSRGEYYLSRAGWGEGGLYLARLHWHDHHTK